MRRICFLVSVLIVAIVWAGTQHVYAATLKEINGDHFIVRYTTSETYAQNILKRAEKYYASIAKDVGYAQSDEGWRLEERCTITLLMSRKEYVAVTGGEESAFSHGHLSQKKIYSYMGQDGFIARSLPHDIAHLMASDFIGLNRHAFLWVHEGLALRSEKIKHKRLLRHVKAAFEEQHYIPFGALMGITQLRAVDNPAMVELFYAESFAIVTFLLDTYDQENFISFCRDLRDNHPITQALTRNYGAWGIESVQHLEEKVKHYV